MSGLGDHAVVLGASMGGLLAARVLADFYSTVTVVERDTLRHDAAHRRGVPQSHHVHGLLSTGSRILDELFPELLDELVTAGANVLEGGDGTRVWLRFAGHDLNRSGRFADPGAVTSFLASRPFLEAHVRARLRRFANVTVLDGHDVVNLFGDGSGRVAGALVADRDTGENVFMDADLVVDATGRAARTPAFLENLGYRRPPEEHIVVKVAYVSQLLRIPSNTLDEKLILVGPVPGRPTGGALFAYENDTWMLTLAGLSGHEPPAEATEMIRFAEEFAPPPMIDAMKAAEPLSEPCRHRYPASKWRRYDKMLHFPAGLLVFGDAICSFNPVYGQGMSVAALEAIVLRDCLLRGDQDLPRRFFRAAAKPIKSVWKMAAGADLALPQAQGRRSASLRLSNWYTAQVLAAATSDPVVTEGFVRVMNLVDPPTRLLRPTVVARIATAGRRHARVEAAVPEPELVAG
ncbi:FAD-dependent oxidoreductase [Mycobacterium celatum]|uniref:2-polyprenyl-6-methoxyphenol hydroxylase-like oxidoreductase n=1 Tax=Mycobacterium celatum TaxID=28045 RepID=A0A1X1RVV6_MYCCE|nr:FAD-binding protein [Mycobacterium celatum]ORV18557.1 2-polyprenyl-6-methoxyphenol hydroxylase-like oxidoreductase [Mycobacterium celatum]PIB80852.1 FAD-binding protein [Mycobacterium celatum]